MKLNTHRAAGRVIGLAALAMLALGTSSASAQKRSKKRAPVKQAAASVKRVQPAWTTPNGATALSDAIGSALSGHTRNGEWGAMVVSLTRGDTLFARNPDAMMQPASTMKMYTSAVALDRFGPDFTFRTPALRDGEIGPNGVLAGNLYIRGVGDASLRSGFWVDESPMDGLA
jgi:D-alanyl-D-alanine carboxypeptidase/D-alanyl-D-alanine-endopeptidase (penicillin-binding protein 4)